VDCPSSPRGPSQYFQYSQVQKDHLYDQISTFPWYIILESGEGCKYFLGGASAIADGRIDYVCNKNNIFLSLPLDKSQGLWKIRCFDETANTLTECSIRQAWF
jgi:hypothetical protein